MTDPTKPTSAAEDVESPKSKVLDDLTWPARRAGWAIEKHVLWPAGDLLRNLGDDLRWPAERLAWAFRRRMVWALQDGVAARGRPLQAALAVGVVGVAVAAAGAGALTGTPSETPATPPKVAVAVAHPQVPPVQLFLPAQTRPPAPVLPSDFPGPGPVLHGVAPKFSAAKKADAGSPGASAQNGGAPSGKADPSVPGGDSTTVAAAPTPPGVPSPAKVKPALDVSRQFADAFVLYEVGKGDSGVRKAFTKTAAKPLVRALKKRPPRLPKGVEVPRAKVLNVVPGPRHGSSLSVSVALVRLGAASELRLQLHHDEKAGWLVSDVRG